LYRQLVTQVTLAILSGDLRPGDRLPSTRELARRFDIHPNTVSAGYRQLEQEGWTVTRHGSGVYVRERAAQPSTPEQVLDLHIDGFFRAVRELRLPAETVRARVAQWLAAPPPDHFLLIDSDAEVRCILLTELRQHTASPVREASLEDCADAGMFRGAIALCRPSKAELVRAALPAGVELITLPITSATAWLTPWLPAPKDQLLAVASSSWRLPGRCWRPQAWRPRLSCSAMRAGQAGSVALTRRLRCCAMRTRRRCRGFRATPPLSRSRFSLSQHASCSKAMPPPTLTASHRSKCAAL
jgi:DNA-binding transcriptional regulator YhcF (GntR family)